MARLPGPGDLSWLTRLRDEVATLPETLKAFRETVEDLRRVAKRLEVITELMERTQTHLDALGITDTARQLDDAVVNMERQWSGLREAMPSGSADVFQDAMRQMRETAAELTHFGARFMTGAADAARRSSDRNKD